MPKRNMNQKVNITPVHEDYGTGVGAGNSFRVFAPFWSENGYRLCPGVWNRVWFSKELRERMNVFIVSIPRRF